MKQKVTVEGRKSNEHSKKKGATTYSETPVVEVVKRGRGRPRGSVSIKNKGEGETVTRRVRQKRIHSPQLLQAEVESGRTVALAANRMVEQLQGMLNRADVQVFRGRREKPQLTISLLEQQALQESLALFEMKVALQRSGQLRRTRVN